MEPAELLKSGEYLDAKKRIASWSSRLKGGGRDDAMRVRDEKDAFFSQMRALRPDLYAVLRIEDKTLSEGIVKRLTGRDVIFD